MIFTLIAVAPLFVLLVLSELLWRAKILRGEPARKSLHIIIGSYVAAWPFFLTAQHIEVLSLALFVGVAVSHKLKIFHAILDVRRRSWGDLFYAIGIGLTALISQSPWVFAAAILHMSLGDGLAGLVGSKWGKKTKYKVLGQAKSLAGSGAFMLTSIVILAIIVPGPMHLSLGLLAILLPLMATLAENLGAHGSDNILVPAVVALTLNTLV